MPVYGRVTKEQLNMLCDVMADKSYKWVDIAKRANVSRQSVYLWKQGYSVSANISRAAESLLGIKLNLQGD